VSGVDDDVPANNGEVPLRTVSLVTKAIELAAFERNTQGTLENTARASFDSSRGQGTCVGRWCTEAPTLWIGRVPTRADDSNRSVDDLAIRDLDVDIVFRSGSVPQTSPPRTPTFVYTAALDGVSVAAFGRVAVASSPRSLSFNIPPALAPGLSSLNALTTYRIGCPTLFQGVQVTSAFGQLRAAVSVQGGELSVIERQIDGATGNVTDTRTTNWSFIDNASSVRCF